MEPLFDVQEYLRSIVGTENFNLGQAQIQLSAAERKRNSKVIIIWALVIVIFYLKAGKRPLANKYLRQAHSESQTLKNEGLESLCCYLQEKLNEAV